MAQLSEKQAIYIMNRTKSALVNFAKELHTALADDNINFWEVANAGSHLALLAPAIQRLLENLDEAQERQAFIRALEHLEFSLPAQSTQLPTDLFN